MNPVGSIFSAIAAVFNWMTGRNTTKNAAAVQAAKQGQAAADAIAKTNDAIEKRDTDEIRKELSE
jgi:hypothetical protein